MKLERIHEINRIAFRVGINAVKGGVDDLLGPAKEGERLVEKSFLLKNVKVLDKEWLNNEDPFNPGGDPDPEGKVVAKAAYHLIMYRKYAFLCKKLMKEKESDPVEYGRQLGVATLFS